MRVCLESAAEGDEAPAPVLLMLCSARVVGLQVVFAVDVVVVVAVYSVTSQTGLGGGGGGQSMAQVWMPLSEGRTTVFHRHGQHVLHGCMSTVTVSCPLSGFPLLPPLGDTGCSELSTVPPLIDDVHLRGGIVTAHLNKQTGLAFSGEHG